MFGVGHVHLAAAEAQEFRFVHELVRQPHHERRKGRREHISVDPLPGQVFLNPFHVGVESHREHVVGLVEDQDFKLIQRKCSLEQMVQHSPGCTDYDVRSFAESFDLGAVCHSTINRCSAYSSLFSEKLSFFCNLASQFSGGDQYQRLAGIQFRVGPLDDRKHEGTGLATSGT